MVYRSMGSSDVPSMTTSSLPMEMYWATRSMGYWDSVGYGTQWANELCGLVD